MMKIRMWVVVCLIAVPIYASPPAKPGQWQVTTEMEMPGMSMKIPPQTVTICVTKEDIEKDPQAMLPKDSHCKILDYKESGNTVTWSVKCEGENAMTGSGKITYSSESYTGSMELKVGDHEMKATYSGKYVGAECKKNDNE